MTIKYEFGPRPGMPPVNVFWYQKAGGDAYLPPGMTAEEARQIPGTGPTLTPAVGGGGGRGGAGGGAGRGAAGRRGAASWRAELLRRLLQARLRPKRLRAGGAAGAGRGGGAQQRQRLQPHLRRVEGLLGHQRPGRRCRAASGQAVGGVQAPDAIPSRGHRGISATGSAPARAERRRAPTSASPVPTPSGWCSDRLPSTPMAS